MYGILDPRTRDAASGQSTAEGRHPGRRPSADDDTEHAAGAAIRQSSLWQDAWRRYMQNKAALAAASSSSSCASTLLIPGFWKIRDLDVAQGLRPERGRLLAVLRRLQPRPPVLDGQVRARPLRARGCRRSDLDRDRLRGDVHDPRHRRCLRLALGLRRRQGRQRDDALPRRALRAPYLPFAIITTQILSPSGSVSVWTMVVSLTIASWFTAARRPRPGDHAEGERLRPCRQGGRRALVPGARPAPPPEHARHPRDRHLPRASGRRPRRGVPLLHRPRHQPADRLLGSIAQDGREAYRLHPEVLFIPCLAIATLVLCANFIADGLRDASIRARERPVGTQLALLEVNDLKTHFFTREGVVQAVDGISFTLEKARRSASSASPVAASR